MHSFSNTPCATLEILYQPSIFAYPAPLEEEKEEKKERITTAVLSTTAKAKAKAKLKEASKSNAGASEGADDAGKDAGKDKDGDSNMADATAGGADKDKKADDGEKNEKEKEKPEPESYAMTNPFRVVYAQHAFVTPDTSNRYRPVNSKQKRNLGVIVLTDSTPDEEDDELMDIEAPPKAGEEGPEPECPEPFDWIPPEFK